MIKNVIFDLDGTLLDTSEGILESVAYSIRQMNWHELSYQDLLSFIGPPLQKSFIDKYECNTKDAQKATDIFREYYSKQAMLKAKPYEGIFETCNQLIMGNIDIAVATNKREDLAVAILNHYGFGTICHTIHGSDTSGSLKKSDIINLCLGDMDANPNETVIIGDSSGDAEGALVTKCKFVAAMWGFGLKSKNDILYPYIGVADKPLQIINIILQNSD